MDDKTTAEPLAHPVATGPGTGRRRRALAAGALLLAVAATVGGCGGGKSGNVSSGAAGATSSASPTAPGSPSASAAPSPAGPAPSPSGAGAPTPAPIRSGEPAPTPAPPTGAPTPPENPTDPQALLKPLSYLTDGNHLTVFFFGGVCAKYGLTADESKAGQVGVRVIVTQPAPMGRMCPALAKREAVAADLSHPLQGRPVVSLDTGADIPLATVPVGGPVSAGN